MASFSIHPNIELGPVHLTVADLDRSLRFYEEVLGFRSASSQNGTASLSADGASPLLVLTERPGVWPKPRHSTGLYHYALLLPSRLDLARSLRRLAEQGHPLQGASDHGVSEALYLDDPDGNGIELYCDRDREAWPHHNEKLQLVTDPLDFDGLLAELEADGRPWQGLPPQTRVGHVHLHVADLAQAEAFYCDLLGFDRIARYGSQALFVSAGGYHHHLGLNTWAGQGAPPPPPDAAGLRHFTLCLPDRAEWERMAARLKESGLAWEEQQDGLLVRDPAANGIVIGVS